MSWSHVRSSVVLWETLVRKERDFVTTPELESLAAKVGKDPRHAIDHLVRAKRLEPLFKGSYYVRKPDELLLNLRRKSPLELFALATRAHDIGRWYFGLHTALRLHGMTHEYRTDEAVISEKLYRIRGIEMGGTKFVVHKWTSDLFGFGVTRLKGLPVSDPARTVLDLAYMDYWNKRHGRTPTGEWTEYLTRVDESLFRSYLERAPKPLREWVRTWT